MKVGRRPFRVGGRRRAKRGEPGGGKSVSCLPLVLNSPGDRKRMETLKKQESKSKQGAFVPFPLWGSERPADPFHHTSRGKSAMSGLSPCALWFRGMQKREAGSLEVPIERGGPTPRLSLAVAETLRTSEHKCGTLGCLAMPREPQAYAAGPDGHKQNQGITQGP